MLAIFLLTLNDNERNQLEELYNQHSVGLYRYACSLLPSSHDAENVMQEAFVRVAKSLDKISTLTLSQTRAYLFTTLKNLCVDFHRAAQKESFSDIEKAESEISTNERDPTWNFIDLQEETSLVLRLLRELPEIEQTLLIQQMQGLSLKQQSALTGMKEKAISIRAIRARKKLMEKYLAKGGDRVAKNVAR